MSAYLRLRGCAAGEAGPALAEDEGPEAEAGSLGRGRFASSLRYPWIVCDLQLDYSLTLQLWQAVFSKSPLHRLDLITGDGLGVDAELVSHLNKKKGEKALCQA